MELPPEYQIIASIIVGVIIIGGAVAKYVRDMRHGSPAIASDDMAELRRLIERRDDQEHSEELTAQIRQLAAALDSHRRQMQDLGRSVEAVASALNRRA
jgi:uncharacterized protein with HEPN domain